MTASKFRKEIISSDDEFHHLEREWDDLLTQSPHSHVYQSFRWHLSWWNQYGEQARLHLVLFRREEDQKLVAIFPTYYGATTVERIKVNAYQFIGTENYASDYASPILASTLSSEEQQHIFHEGIKQYTDASLVRFHNLREDSDFSVYLRSIATAQVTAPYSAWAMEIDIESKKAIPNKKLHKRILNRFKKAGEHSIQHFRTADEILPQLDDFFEQHTRRWKSTLSTTQFEDPREREFFISIVKELCTQEVVVFSALRLDGKLVAAHLGFLFRDRLYWYKPSYDPELSKLSLGTLILGETFRYAAEQGATIFDFTIGDEGYKKPYSEIETKMNTVIIPENLWIKVYLKTISTLRMIKQRLTVRHEP